MIKADFAKIMNIWIVEKSKCLTYKSREKCKAKHVFYKYLFCQKG